MHVSFPPDFLFGVSNASGQVEDKLNDVWMQHADTGMVSCFKDIPFAEERLRFWTSPEIELDLAQELGVQIFRLSIDWGRLVQQKDSWDEEAARRYREILSMIRARGMKVMLTLFHHSVPRWFQDEGGWTNANSSIYFQQYSEKALLTFNDLVDFWLTLNEPVPWSFLSYCEGIFPPAKKGNWLNHRRALKNMSKAHRVFYQKAHSVFPEIKVSFAHHVGFHQGRGFCNHLLSRLSDKFLHWDFLKSVSDT